MNIADPGSHRLGRGGRLLAGAVAGDAGRPCWRRPSRSRCSVSSMPPSRGRWPGPTSSSSSATPCPARCAGARRASAFFFDDLVAAFCTLLVIAAWRAWVNGNGKANDDTPALAGLLADLLQQKGWMLATAESCTGGLIAGACTDLSGSSLWFERGFVTYSNDAKTRTARRRCGADRGRRRGQRTGRARDGGGRGGALAGAGRGVGDRRRRSHRRLARQAGRHGVVRLVGGRHVRTERRRFDGDRAAVRAATVQHALQTLVEPGGRAGRLGYDARP